MFCWFVIDGFNPQKSGCMDKTEKVEVYSLQLVFIASILEIWHEQRTFQLMIIMQGVFNNLSICTNKTHKVGSW